jgi:NADPH:quinone reductase-like Zn-dependent oxidoreductase
MRIHPLSVIVLLLALSVGAAGSAAGAAGGDSTMRAALVSAGQIQIRDVARPVAGPGQVLVNIRYAGVNPGDWKAAGGSPEAPAMPGASAALDAPMIPGVDAAGVIAAVGQGVTGYRIGDAVIV